MINTNTVNRDIGAELFRDRKSAAVTEAAEMTLVMIFITSDFLYIPSPACSVVRMVFKIFTAKEFQCTNVIIIKQQTNSVTYKPLHRCPNRICLLRKSASPETIS